MGAGDNELIGIPFPEHSSDLLSSLNEQRHTGQLCDVTIVTQGLEYRTHRAVLAACSRYFSKLFTAGPPGRRRHVCQLDFVPPDVLAALLEFAYTATLTISSGNMREVLQAARLLEIQCVADACGDILRCSGGESPGPAPVLGEQGNPEAGENADVRGNPEVGGNQEVSVIREVRSPEIRGIPEPIHPEITGTPEVRGFIDGGNPEVTGFPEGRDQDIISPEVGGNSDAGGHPSPVALPEAMPRKVRQRKRPAVTRNHRGHLYRIMQPLRTFLSSVTPSEHPASPTPPEARCPSVTASQRGAGEEEEEVGEYEDYWGKAAGRPPLPSPADEESLEPDSASYLTSLGNGALMVSPDKLGRRRKSQMPQECPICHKVIHGAGKLPRHMRTHTGEKPFVCEVCDVRFTRNDKLKIHMRKHTGERPYSCSCCDARFLHSYDLKNHARLHTGDRPFECRQCRKAFVRLDHLQRHLKGQNCPEVRVRKRRLLAREGEAEELPPSNGYLVDQPSWLPAMDGGFPEPEPGQRTPPADGGYDPDTLPGWSHGSGAWDQEGAALDSS
ncbi:zinc finger and BTB domain-containing protein 7B-like isoform X2 [Narcine bancroftii]